MCVDALCLIMSCVFMHRLGLQAYHPGEVRALLQPFRDMSLLFKTLSGFALC